VIADLAQLHDGIHQYSGTATALKPTKHSQQQPANNFHTFSQQSVKVNQAAIGGM